MRTERSKQSRQEIMRKILDAAVVEFSQHGFQGASTQAIAERAQLKKSQLHYYIEDKEALYSQVLGKVLDSWRGFFTFDASPELLPREALGEFVRLKLDYALENPELSRIFTMEILSGGARLEAYWPGAMEATHAKVSKIDSWVQRGELRPLDGRLLIMHIWALTQYYSDYRLQAELLLEASLTESTVRSNIEQELIRFVLLGAGLSSD
tara:strand:- start:406 stop:1032 length:627 start_codon:yes stop_codon:yes gene_type:complete